MKKTTLNLDFNAKKMRTREFLEEMNEVSPFATLVERIAPYYSEGRRSRPLFSLSTILRVYFMQQ